MLRRPAMLLLRLYQLALSPVLQAFGTRCRHTPSCSAFMMEAMRQHGFWAGGWAGAARLWRCRPGGTHGHDPVPDRLTGAWWRPWAYGRWR